MFHFLGGCLFFANLVVAVFFLRFWRRTADRLFALFAVAFLLLAVQRLALDVFGHDNEQSTWLYLLRLAAFGIIAAAIVDRNRVGKR